MLKAAGVELVQLKDTIHLNVERIPSLDYEDSESSHFLMSKDEN